jgi:hypothetical protein
VHSLIIPDIKVHLLRSIGVLALTEETFAAELLLVLLINVDGQNYRAGGDV